jgi:hypothetical protein
MAIPGAKFMKKLRLAGSVWNRLELLDKLLRSRNGVQDLNLILSRLDVPKELFDAFQRDRYTKEYTGVFDKPNPLVTICVATYNRSQTLVERCVSSLLAQSHKNIQIIVVGDACSDDTPTRMATIKDSRLYFKNLSVRGDYPAHPEFRWMVAGTKPTNRALDLAEGDFITHLDDDDEHTPDRIEKLLTLIKEKKADLVWHPFCYEKPNNEWVVNKADIFAEGRVTTSSVLYHRWFKRIGWDPEAYRNHEPGDWNRFRKFIYFKAVIARHPEILLRHYRERTQVNK